MNQEIEKIAGCNVYKKGNEYFYEKIYKPEKGVFWGINKGIVEKYGKDSKFFVKLVWLNHGAINLTYNDVLIITKNSKPAKNGDYKIHLSDFDKYPITAKWDSKLKAELIK